ncbi:nucleotidyltransferase family protein [Gracilibacillus phocaeensis]|uniref:nucleotidyltransferase family protein n=1 Tax=Gracilibacillus phocaeensis TaxID=2042304 RepID=UPI0013EF4E63|nr:nucleotidyltransferase domain-containing protein [Gracilibacillus phocaeensis]
MINNDLSQPDLVSTDREDILNYLKFMVKDVLKESPCKVYLFGSWALNEEKHSSDIDIAMDAPADLSEKSWVALRERIEESQLPYRVDLIDLPKASIEIKNKIRKEGILWKD